MFALYYYNLGASQANILADLTAILTGTTDKELLSAACDKPSTSISNAYTDAGWELHDAAPAAGSKMLKALCQDNTYYKYFGLDLNTAGQIKFAGAETWNADTHVGTNIIYAAGTGWTSHIVLNNAANFAPASTAGSILIYANRKEIHLSFRNSGTFSWDNVCMEWTRGGVNSALSKGYPCWGITYQAGNNNIVCRPRSKAISINGDVVGATNTSYLQAMATRMFSGEDVMKRAFREAGTEATVFDFYPCSAIPIVDNWREYISSTHQYLGNIQSECRMSTAGAALDECTIEGVTYIRGGFHSAFAFNETTNVVAQGIWYPKG
jgi:hypothetical protein